MSRVGVIVALVIAVVLALAAFLLLRPPAGGSAPAGPLLDVEASKLTEIRIAGPGAEPQIARRLPGGSWVIMLGDAEPWPASGERIRPALRILSTLEAVRPAERGTELSDFVTVTLTLEDGSVRTLRLGTRSLAGAVLAEADTPDGMRRAWVDADVSNMLAGTGLGEWRDSTAMGELGGDISRISLRSGDAELALGRIEGRWALTSPVSEPAEPDAVARLFSLVGDTGVVDFLDAGPPDATGLDSPTAVLVIESDHRDPSDPAKVTTRQRTLEVGRIADVGGRNVFARLSGRSEKRGGEPRGGGGWSRVVIVNGEPLAEITTDPSRYIARTALQTPAADIGRIEVSGAEGLKAAFGRGLDGWRRIGENSSEVPLGAADGAGLQAVLDLLTAAQAEAVLLKGPAEVVWTATIEIQSLAGMPLARVRVGLLNDGKGVIGGEGVWRVYPAAAATGGVEWVSGL